MKVVCTNQRAMNINAYATNKEMLDYFILEFMILLILSPWKKDN